MAGEGGWSVPDHIAILAALHRRARVLGVPVVEHARAYCEAIKQRGTLTRRQRWVLALPPAPALTAPPGWPDNASWARHRPLWLAVLERASRAPVKPDCALPPEKWAARDIASDLASIDAHLASGEWVDAGCRGTRNLFLARRR